MKIEELPELITPKQIAELFGWHTNTVYLKCQSGELPSFKVGNSRRIRKQALLDWMNKLESEVSQ